MMARTARSVALIAVALAATAGCTSAPSPAPTSAAPTSSAPAASQVGTAFTLPGDRVYPEGIALDERTGDRYVGSFADGTIYRATADAAAAEVFLPAGADGRKTANGLHVDGQGRLWVIDSSAGVDVYDLANRALVARFDVPNPAEPHFVNDLAITADGTAYLTDSQRDVVYRVTPDQVRPGARAELDPRFDLRGVVPPHGVDAYTLNGIVAGPGETYLLVVDTTNGLLYRIELGDGHPSVVRLTGGDMRHGDGLALDGSTLRVVQNTDNVVSRWTIADDGTAATRDAAVTDPALELPTTLVHTSDRSLVVASQFDKGGPLGQGTPRTPFEVHTLAD